MKVLMVEDSKELLLELQKSITMIDGIEIVGTAHSEKEAIAMYRRTNPEVITLDIRLKNGNGLKVLETVKKDSPAPVVLMLTNYPFPQYREKCRKLGADFFFDKSGDFQIFLNKLKEIQATISKNRRNTYEKN